MIGSILSFTFSLMLFTYADLSLGPVSFISFSLKNSYYILQGRSTGNEFTQLVCLKKFLLHFWIISQDTEFLVGWAFLCVCLNTLKYCIPLSLIAWFLRRYLILFLSLVLKRFLPPLASTKIFSLIFYSLNMILCGRFWGAFILLIVFLSFLYLCLTLILESSPSWSLHIFLLALSLSEVFSSQIHYTFVVVS